MRPPERMKIPSSKHEDEIQVPKGRLSLAQDAVLGRAFETRLVPKGRLKIVQGQVAAYFQPSLRDSVAVLRSSFIYINHGYILISGLRLFPRTRFSSAENGFDDGHVLDCVGQRNGYLGPFAHGFGKDVALNRVLITGWERFYRDTAAG